MFSLHDKRQSGISLIGDLPWGSHFCQFYQTDTDLLEFLVPFFRAGLENNEYCLWITSEILDADKVEKALREAVPGFEKYADGQLEIIPYSRWRAADGKAGSAVVSKLDQAVTSGFEGLRLACNAMPGDCFGEAFTSHCADSISRNNVIALFMYPRDRFDTLGLMEAVKHHRFALVRNAGGWEVIASSEARITRDALKRTEEKLESLFSNMSEGFAYHRIVLDSGRRPCDYIFLEINQAFERLTGLKGEKIIGKRVTKVLPGIEKDPTDWIGRYGQVALTGKPVSFESYSEALEKWYAVSAFSPQKGYFALTFSDITRRKQGEERQKLLSDFAGMLLSTDTPERIVENIAGKIMTHLDCQTYFNFIVDGAKSRLHLNACGGIPEETAAAIEWLDYGVAVCGTVAKTGQRMIKENILDSPDSLTELVHSFGIDAYACHPLISKGAVIGTLSFGTRTRPAFLEDEIEFMRVVANQVATAMERKRAESELRRQRDELDEYKGHLEQMVEVRTADLLEANLRLSQEIDERLRAEEQLRASERRLKEAEKIAHLGHWELDLGSSALFWSDEVYRIFDLDPREFGASYEAFLDVIHPEDRELVNQSYADSVKNRTPYDIVHRLRMKDGSVKFVNEKCLTDYDEAGKPLRSLGTVLDITVRKLAEEELQQHREHLEELVRERTAELLRANKELQDFAFIASHDLQEPLRKVIAFGDRLRAKYAAVLDERGQDYLLRMENAAERMRELINDLLELSRVTTKAMPFTITDLEAVAHNVLSDLSELVTMTGAEVRIGSLPALEADKIQIRQLFLNLLTNALKFHDEGASPRVSIESRIVDGFCELAVTDNGIGFDEKYLDRIFRPFQRLHGRGVFRGSGMGLSICKKIVERHGGEITARSAPGQGATFFIKLPLKQIGATHE